MNTPDNKGYVTSGRVAADNPAMTDLFDDYDDGPEIPLLFRGLIRVLALAWTIAATWYVIVTITPSNWILLFVGWAVAESVVFFVVGAVLTALSLVWWKLLRKYGER